MHILNFLLGIDTSSDNDDDTVSEAYRKGYEDAKKYTLDNYDSSQFGKRNKDVLEYRRGFWKAIQEDREN